MLRKEYKFNFYFKVQLKLEIGSVFRSLGLFPTVINW